MQSYPAVSRRFLEILVCTAILIVISSCSKQQYFGKIVDLPTRDPIANAAIQLLKKDANLKTTDPLHFSQIGEHLRSGANGDFTIIGSALFEYIARIDAPGHATRFLPLTAGHSTLETAEIVGLEREAIAFFHLTKRKFDTIGAMVYVWPAHFRMEYADPVFFTFMRAIAWRGVFDENRICKISGLPPGMPLRYELWDSEKLVFIRRDAFTLDAGFNSSIASDAEVSIPRARETREGDVAAKNSTGPIVTHTPAPPKLISIRGRVVTTTGERVEGVVVRTARSLIVGEYLATTGADGTFVLENIPSDDYQLAAAGNDIYVESDFVKYNESGAAVQITVQKKIHLSGKVILPEGSAPSAICNIWALPHDRPSGLIWGFSETKTDVTNQQFKILLSPKYYDCFASDGAGNFGYIENVKVTTDETTPVEIKLSLGARLRISDGGNTKIWDRWNASAQFKRANILSIKPADGDDAIQLPAGEISIVLMARHARIVKETVTLAPGELREIDIRKK
ncbi:MAG: hypothetical protein ACKVS6_10360 [Planctomycetota bacterium]